LVYLLDDIIFYQHYGFIFQLIDFLTESSGKVFYNIRKGEYLYYFCTAINYVTRFVVPD